MSKKHAMFILLMCLIGISILASVSASDLNESMTMESDSSVDDATISLSYDDNNQKDLSSDEAKLGDAEYEVLSANYTPQSFGDIQNVINGAEDGDTIVLDGAYVATSSDVGIIVNKSVNFVGINRATVDGVSKIKLFDVTVQGVTFKNILFKNGYSSTNGGAISDLVGDGVSVENCTFFNNFANEYGGALYLVKNVINCKFIYNIASSFGGAIYNNQYNVGSAINCSFVNNSATSMGGALYGNNAINCRFENNSAAEGGAIRQRYQGPSTMTIYAYNCTFINNSAHYGGAMFVTSSSSAINCSFIDNSADRQGGAMENGKAIDCYFKNNSVTGTWTLGNGGGAMISGTALNCTFVENSGSFGSVICNGEANNCTFIKNSGYALYESEAVNCSFFDGGSLNMGTAINCNFTNSGMFSASATNCIFINSSNRACDGCTLVNCTFANNSAGATYNCNALNCTFINNSATYGGAISGGTSTHCIFINNSATYGGAMYGGAVINCTFFSNSATYGGAVYFGGYDQYGGNEYVANLADCTFVGNYATYGGAVCSHEQEHYSGGDKIMTIQINNCSFINNSATSKGGAIEISHHYRLLNVTDSIFINDTVKNGDGGAVFTTRSGNILNSSFINCSSNKGGAIWTESNLNVILCNFTKCTSSDENNYLGCSNPSLYNITDCFFDIVPQGIIYHYTTTLTVNNLFIAKGEKGFLYANLSNVCGPLSNKKVNFMFNGRKFYGVTNSEGIAEFNVNNYLTDLGETIIDLSFAGDDVNYPSTTNANVYLIKYFGNLTVELDGQFYNDTILKFRLVNSITNVPISGAPIKLNFSNAQIIDLTTDFEGNAIYVIPFIPDTYSVNAYVDDDYVDVNNVSVENIVIKKLIGEIEVTPLNDNHTLMIRLFDPDDSTAIYRNVRINLDVGPNPIVKEELYTNERGYVIYDLLNFTKGTYSISVTVRGDYKDFYDYYLADYIISNLLNSKINFTNNITFDFGEFGSTNFTVEGATVEYFKIKVIDHPEAIIGLGSNSISVSQLSVGDYVLLVETTPDDYHNPINATLNITVNMVKSKVTFSTGVAFEYGGSATIHVTVDGGSVNGKTIQVIGHPEAKITFVKDMITVSNLNPGAYTLRVESIPDSDHKVGEGTVGITVRKATAVIKASKLTVALKSGALWAVKLVDSKYGRPISNMKVTLMVFTGKKYKTVTLTTNSKGEAYYRTSSLTKGNHKVVVSATHEGYNFNTLTSSISVIKPTKLSFKVKKNIAKDGSSLSITVMKGKKPINGVSINLLVYTGKKYKVITLKSKNKGKYKGVCGWGTNKISAGNHKVVIVPENIKYSGSKTVKMNLKKSAKKYPNWETKI